MMVARHPLKVVCTVAWMLMLLFSGALAEFKMGMLFSGPYDDSTYIMYLVFWMTIILGSGWDFPGFFYLTTVLFL
jgi:hypothetical protein